MELVKIKYYDSYFNENTVWCLRNETASGGEFTACGTAITEGEVEADLDKIFGDEQGYKVLDYKYKGKITCPECKRVVNFYKSLPKNCT